MEMEVLPVNYLPGDPLLIENIVCELKSQGIFDSFRKECIADVDTKPAYQNLRQRVEGSVSGFLKKQRWSAEMNKNHVREMLRKNIYESGFLETGVERIVDQVVNPKMNSVFLPKITEVVYKYLGIKPEKSDCDNSHLLPTDLEAVSPESDHNKNNDDQDDKMDICDDDKNEDKDEESPPFEPLDDNILNNEENSIDSHISGFSALGSHDSNQSEAQKPLQIDLDSQTSSETKNVNSSDAETNRRDDKKEHSSRSREKSRHNSSSSSKHHSRSNHSKDPHKRSHRSRSRDRKRESTSSRHKSSKSRHRSRTRSRDRKKHSSSSSSKSSRHDKDRKKRSKDDHYSSKTRPERQRSTDRDSNDGVTSNKSSNSSSNSSSTTQTSKQSGGGGNSQEIIQNCEGTTKAASLTISADKFAAMEAQLNSHIDFNSYGGEDEQFMYFSENAIDSAESNRTKTKNIMRKLDEEIRDIESKIALSICNNLPLLDNKRKSSDKLTSLKRIKNNNHLVVDNEFSLPLSPAESDSSFDKRVQDVAVLNESKRKINNSTQRYSSEDLYKPRLMFKSRRRGNLD